VTSQASHFLSFSSVCYTQSVQVALRSPLPVVRRGPLLSHAADSNAGQIDTLSYPLATGLISMGREMPIERRRSARLRLAAAAVRAPGQVCFLRRICSWTVDLLLPLGGWICIALGRGVRPAAVADAGGVECLLEVGVRGRGGEPVPDEEGEVARRRRVGHGDGGALVDVERAEPPRGAVEHGGSRRRSRSDPWFGSGRCSFTQSI